MSEVDASLLSVIASYLSFRVDLLSPILPLSRRYAAAFSYSTRLHILNSETRGRIRSEGQVHHEVAVYQAFMQEVSSSLITGVKTGLEKGCLLKVAMRWPFLTHTLIWVCHRECGSIALVCITGSRFVTGVVCRIVEWLKRVPNFVFFESSLEPRGGFSAVHLSLVITQSVRVSLLKLHSKTNLAR